MLNRNSLKPVRAKTFTITVVVILSNPKAQYLQAVATNFEFLFGKLAIALLWGEVLIFVMFYRSSLHADTDSLGACLAHGEKQTQMRWI